MLPISRLLNISGTSVNAKIEGRELKKKKWEKLLCKDEASLIATDYIIPSQKPRCLVK